MIKKERIKFRGREMTREEKEFEQKIVDIARVTRVTAGGKRMRFRACVVLGDRKGQVGYGIGKGADVTMAVSKAVAKARKNLIKVPLIRETIPHEVREKFGAARILIKPAPVGTGIKSGGAPRIVFELAGISNIVSKILGSGNKINNVRATFNALQRLEIRKK
jgi:small subunit ribosomal protein S5